MDFEVVSVLGHPARTVASPRHRSATYVVPVRTSYDENFGRFT